MKVDSLQTIYGGFQKLTEFDQAEYLKYFALVIQRTNNPNEKNKLIRFKTKLEKKSAVQEKGVSKVR